MKEKIKSVKSKIEKLIEEGRLGEAKFALDKYNTKMPGDQDICSMYAVIHIIEGELENAEKVLLEGLEKDSVHFDLLFNLAYIYEQRGQLRQAVDLYSKAGTVAIAAGQKGSVAEAIERLKLSDGGLQIHEKARIVFFVKEGMDSFLGDIIHGLSEDYWVRKIIVSNLRQIDEGMEWADICWFEWCDELVAYGSRLPLAQQRKIICRLHSYEAFTQYVDNVEWASIDKVILIADHIRGFVLDKQKNLRPEQTVIIPNGIDPDKYKYRECEPGFNIAYVGYLNYKKGPMLLLHTFKAIFDTDKRYKLYIAGKFQDYRDELYFSQMIKEFGIEDNVIYEGWQDDINQWLEDKNYILCTSLLESQNISVMQAMCKGIKPVVHNFVGARGIYPDEYVWNTIDEAIDMILSDKYESSDYRAYIVDNYSFKKQLANIGSLLEEHLTFSKMIRKVNNILSGFDKPDDANLTDTTMLTPTYNRASMIEEDLDRAFNFPSVPKLFVDDCSDESNRNILKGMMEAGKYGIVKIIFRDKNGGVAAALSSGVNTIDTKYTIIKGDDDILMRLNDNWNINEILQRCSLDYPFLIPRYVLNLAEDGGISLGYDREELSGNESYQVLLKMFLTGEMVAMSAGAIFGTDDLISSLPEDIFRVSEDYIMASRILSRHGKLPIFVCDSIVYIRRISSRTLSRTIDETKLTLTLLSMMVSGYYCLKNDLVNKSVFIDAISKREDRLNEYYNYEKGFSDIIEKYSQGKSGIDILIKGLNDRGVIINSKNELPIEVINMPDMYRK
jgi:glycosyltransferase involved in cell wall biosynthesis